MNTLKKRLLAIAMVSTMAVSLVACSTSSADTSDSANNADSSTSADADTDADADADADVEDETPEFVTVSAVNGEGEWIDMDVPYYPERIVFMDYVSLDMCASLGILENVEYMCVQDALPSYLEEYVGDDIVNMGGLKTYQEDTTILTTIMEFEPDLIFTSGRSAGDYETFLELVAEGGAVVSSSISYTPSTYESFISINTRNASIFGLEDEMDELIASYDARLEELQTWGADQSAVMTIFTGGSMNVLGSESRCSMIFNDLGFENVGTDVDTSHGDTASYEALLALDPDYIFVLDRDSAIGTEGATAAMELLDNEIIQQTTAWKEGKVVSLDPIVWYMSEGGATAMNTMLSDLEAGMEIE